jgi:hypothetical protein
MAHAWKANLDESNNAYQTASSHFGPITSAHNDVPRYASVTHYIRVGFDGHLTHFLTQHRKALRTPNFACGTSARQLEATRTESRDDAAGDEQISAGDETRVRSEEEGSGRGDVVFRSGSSP